MSRAWRFAMAAAQVLFLLALTVGVYVQVIALTPALPSPPGPEVAASASIGPIVRDDRVPAPAPISPDAHPPSAPSPAGNGSAPAAGGVVFGAPADQKPLFVAPNVASPTRPVPNAAPLVTAPLVGPGIAAPIVTTTATEVARHGESTVASVKAKKDVSARGSASRQGPKRPKQPRS